MFNSSADSSAALQQKATGAHTSRPGSGHDRNRLSAHWAPTGDAMRPSHITIPPPGISHELNIRPGTPLSQIRGFPDNTSPAGQTATNDTTRQASPLLVPQPFQAPDALSLAGGDGFNGPDTLALPQVGCDGPLLVG